MGVDPAVAPDRDRLSASAADCARPHVLPVNSLLVCGVKYDYLTRVTATVQE